MSLDGDILGLIEGRRVVGVGDDSRDLILDDGTVLRLYMSDSDCCAHAVGSWQSHGLDAMITKVAVEPDLDRSGDNGDGTTNYATITILHNQNPLATASCYADNGNGGYYYSTLSLRVYLPSGRFRHLDLTPDAEVTVEFEVLNSDSPT